MALSDAADTAAATGSSGPSSLTSPLSTSPGALFPARLFQLLEDVVKEGNEDAISWLPDGKSFKVHDRVKFETLMPKYFGSAKFRSFQKNLNLWEFKTVLALSSPHRGECSHPLFVRDAPELSKGMKRVVKSKLQKKQTADSTTTSTTVATAAAAPLNDSAITAAAVPSFSGVALPRRGSLVSPAPGDEVLRMLQTAAGSTNPSALLQSTLAATGSRPTLLDDTDSPLVKQIRARAERAAANSVILDATSSQPSLAALEERALLLERLRREKGGVASRRVSTPTETALSSLLEERARRSSFTLPAASSVLGNTTTASSIANLLRGSTNSVELPQQAPRDMSALATLLGGGGIGHPTQTILAQPPISSSLSSLLLKDNLASKPPMLGNATMEAPENRLLAEQLLARAQMFNDELSRTLGLLDQLNNEPK